MITLPDFGKAFEYENNFYLSCQNSRIGKFLAHYELYKLSHKIAGDIVECGVFKGSSFVRFAMFQALLGANKKKELIGFDTFGDFPKTSFEQDKKARQRFIKDAGLESISSSQLRKVLQNKGVTNVELVAGDINKTVPEYARAHPQLKISLLNLDTDIYEPAVTILEHLYPRLVKGGILILDDYNIFSGETKAVSEYFKGQRVKIQKFPFAKTPCYIIKK